MESSFQLKPSEQENKMTSCCFSPVGVTCHAVCYLAWNQTLVQRDWEDFDHMKTGCLNPFLSNQKTGKPFSSGFVFLKVLIQVWHSFTHDIRSHKGLQVWKHIIILWMPRERTLSTGRWKMFLYLYYMLWRKRKLPLSWPSHLKECIVDAELGCSLLSKIFLPIPWNLSLLNLMLKMLLW